VRRDLGLPGLPQRKVIATIVGLLDQTGIRIGNDEYAKSNSSYGLTTLKDRHAEIRGANLRLHFRGKSKQDHDITVRDLKLAKIVKQCQDIPGQELFQYKLENGESMRVDSGDVNAYLGEITQDDFTAKDFSTWQGTGHMIECLAEIGRAGSESEAKRNLAAAVKETAKRLGNRPPACRKYYVHPAVFESYLEQTIFKVIPDGGLHAVGSVTKLQPVEVAILRLVASHSPHPAARRAKAS